MLPNLKSAWRRGPECLLRILDGLMQASLKGVREATRTVGRARPSSSDEVSLWTPIRLASHKRMTLEVSRGWGPLGGWVSLTACAGPVSGRRLAKADVHERVGRRGWWAGSKMGSTRWGVLGEPRSATMRRRGCTTRQSVEHARERRSRGRVCLPSELGELWTLLWRCCDFAGNVA